MSERTIHIVQRCSAEEAAAIVSAICAFDDDRLAPRPVQLPSLSVARGGPESAQPGDRRAVQVAGGRSGTAIVWTRSEASLGRGT